MLHTRNTSTTKTSFKVRGYQSFRSDGIGRSKGGILTLVRNNIDAIQTTTHMDDSEVQVLNLKKKDFHMLLAASTVIHRAGDMAT